MVIDMRFILFFVFLFLYSYQVFADEPPAPACASVGSVLVEYNSNLSNMQTYCINGNTATNKRIFVTLGPGNLISGQPTTKFRCDSSCTCPPPSVYNIVVNAQGVPTAGCVVPATGGEPDSCEESEKVYDPVSETMVCPGSGDGSSASSAQSSNMCVVPGDFNGDCIPDDEQGSSAANSSAAASTPPTSSPDTGSSGNGGGGNNGGGDNGGGNNSGGGSASSSASTGSNSSYTPNSGYGNWIPVAANSNCPNKYQDASGQWWCSGGNSPQQGSAASVAAGTCDPTATDYWACINSAGGSSAGSSGATSSDDSESRLQDIGDELKQKLDEDIDDELSDYGDAYTDDIDSFARDGVGFADEPSMIKSVLISFLPVSTTCQPPVLEIFNERYEFECNYFNIFKQALGWFLAVMTAFQIWQMAIRPVER